jgi:F0F1-type ATP synthase assembly protein I
LPEPERPGSPLRYAGLGIQLAAALVLGVLGGQWLDRKLGTDGVFVIVGAFLGFGLTLASLIRQLGGGNGPKR